MWDAGHEWLLKVLSGRRKSRNQTDQKNRKVIGK